MWQDFKEFISQGNVMSLAVAVIIGTTFSSIVSSLVDDIIMPVVGLFLGGINISGLTFTLGDAQIKYGIFLQNIVDFFIIGFSIFLFVRLFNRLKLMQEEEEEEEVDEQVELLQEIRDVLKSNKNP